MNSIVKMILVGVVCFILGFGVNFFTGPDVFKLTGQIAALEVENGKLQDRLEFQRRVEDVMVHDWVELNSKVKSIEKLDTNGISCTDVVNAVFNEAKAEVANTRIGMSLFSEWNDTLQAIGRRHFELTKDTTLIPKLQPETFYKKNYKKYVKEDK